MQGNNYIPDVYGETSTIYSNNDNRDNFHPNYEQQPPQLSNNNSTNTPNNVQATQCFDDLRSVDEILPRYRSIFANYPYFNIIQSRVLDVVLYSDESVVVSAPTGSGKTTIFELAIVRFLTKLENCGQEVPYKIVYVAPMKALCEERLIDWHRKFASLGLSCISVTGDSDNVDFQSLVNHNLIITTPEKWDSLTRKWSDNKKLAALVKLFMIDEVHLISENHRGPTLEAVVCRMKTIQDLVATSDSTASFPTKIRFVAASATVPNVEDLAEWLSMPTVPARSFKFGDDMRPVKLKKVVLGYPYNSQTSTPFKFDIMLSYKLQSIMLQYAEGKPTLIFCNTRKSVEMTSKQITQNLTINLNPQQRQILETATTTISDNSLKEMLPNGVCYHHAGLCPEDRKIVEDLFRNVSLPILVTTSTLAMGVNLPAHLVIIKSTKHYSNGEYRDYSESMLLQMIGRAGRPQFDSSATAVILTTANDKKKFENMVGGQQFVESNLHKHLAEHVNAEVVLHTITDLGVAMVWLTSTFLYIRARKHPRYYGLPLGLSPDQIDTKLLEMCQIEINKLARAGMITIDQSDIIISPTSTGLLMAKYCIAFDTMKLFTQVTGKEILQQMLTLISKCQEFSEIYLRVNDKKALNLLNKCRNGETIRFPFNGKIKTVDMKINCIIQAVFGCLQIVEQSLVTESQKIMRIGERISKCLADYLETEGNSYSALLSALILAKCFHARLWENSPFVSKQLSGIGSVLSSALVAAGKTTFKSLLEANPRDIERITNRRPPMGNTIQEQVAHLPEYELHLEEVVGDGQFSVKLRVCLKNSLLLRTQSSVNVNSLVNLLVGDTDNKMFLNEKYKHSYLMDNPEIVKTFQFSPTYEHEIKAHLISEDWVGFDCNVSLVPSSAKKTADKNKNNLQGAFKKETKTGASKQPSHIQTFMDTYFKNSKDKNQKQKQENKSRTLMKRKSSDNDKENPVSSSNVSNGLHCLEKPKKPDSGENLANVSTNQIRQPAEKEQHCLKRQNSKTVALNQMEGKRVDGENFADLVDSTNAPDVRHESAFLEISSEARPQTQKLQKFIDDCIKEYKKQKECKLDKSQNSSGYEYLRGYSMPPSVTQSYGAEVDSASTSLVCSNNYSATARRNSDFVEKGNPVKNTDVKSVFGFSQQTPSFRKEKNRLEKNMNYTVNSEQPLYDSSGERDNVNKLSDSIRLEFEYTRSKIYSHEPTSSKITQKPVLNTPSKDEPCDSTQMLSPRNEIEDENMGEYTIQEHLGKNMRNAAKASADGSLKPSENFQKTLTWRSPLVTFPAVKHSPIFHKTVERQRETTEENIHFSNCCNSATLAPENKPNVKFSISVNNDSSETSTSVSEANLARPTLRQNMLKKVGTIPLSDQAYSQSISQRQALNSETFSSNNTVFEDPLLSTSLLENLGLIQKQSSGQLQTASLKEDGNSWQVNKPRNTGGAQVKKVVKDGKVVTESQYYLQLVSNPTTTEAKQSNKQADSKCYVLENKENIKPIPEGNVKVGSSQVHQNSPNSAFPSQLQQPTKVTDTQIVDVSKQDIFDMSSVDRDAGTTFIRQMFGPARSNNDSLRPSTTKMRLFQIPVDNSNNQNSFVSEIAREKVKTAHSNSRADSFVSYNHPPTPRSSFDFAVSREPSEGFSRMQRGSLQQMPMREQLGRYHMPKFTSVSTQHMSNDFTSQTGNCKCAECVQHFPSQGQLRPHFGTQNSHSCYHYPKPSTSQMHTYNEPNHPKHCHDSISTPYCYPRVPRKYKRVDQNSFLQQPQPDPNYGFWGTTNNPRPWNGHNYSLHGHVKRQKLQGHHGAPSVSRSSFHDRDSSFTHMHMADDICTTNRYPYPHHESFSQTYMPLPEFSQCPRDSYPQPPFVEYGAAHPPMYNQGDKEFILQRYLNSVEYKQQEQHAEPSMERVPECYAEPPLDFTICIDEMGDVQGDDDGPSSG